MKSLLVKEKFLNCTSALTSLLVTAGQAAAEEGKLSAGLIEPVDSSM
jgi:hypothetical protein